MPETIPSATTRSILSTNWNLTNVVTPTFLDINSGVALKHDLRQTSAGQDLVVIRIDVPGQEETPIGNWLYVNRVSRVLVELYTAVNRQRLYDLMAEVRRIMHARRHSETTYQRIQFKNFTELVNENQNIWSGRVILEYVNNAVLAET